MSTHPLHWAAEHPVPVAIGVFAVGAVLLLMMSGGGGGSQAGAGMSAFYAAQAAQAQDNAAVATTQSNNAAALGIAQIQTNGAVAMNQSNNAAATAINQSNNNLSAYETYKQIRLATQQSEFAYMLDFNGHGAGFSDQLANISHALSFGSAQ